MRVIGRSTAKDMRKATNLQTVEPGIQDYEKENTLNQLADCVVSKSCLASGRHVDKTEKSLIVNAADAKEAISGISYLCENGLTATLTPSPDNGKPYDESRTAAMVQAIVDKTVFAKFESVDFDLCLPQTPDDIVSSLQYLFKLTEAQLDTDEFLKTVAHVVKTKAEKVVDISQKKGEQIKRFDRAAEKTVSERSSQSNAAPPMNICDDSSNQREY